MARGKAIAELGAGSYSASSSVGLPADVPCAVSDECGSAAIQGFAVQSTAAKV